MMRTESHSQSKAARPWSEANVVRFSGLPLDLRLCPSGLVKLPLVAVAIVQAKSSSNLSGSYSIDQ